MCLAIPMQITTCTGDKAKVTCAGTSLDISVAFIDNPKVGDYVLVHAGFALQKIDEEQARETAKLLNQIAELSQQELPK